ncbi:DISARM system helicase DrmA [Deinococcus sp. AJ005]|uniref:DISARM system helicase DrmA n=1 Tax=Deinococcus sp. AJ005 TaxID=2652443 RepID=UPI00125CC025|nr:DISARM system helicase DrmA [Deinococcus sp. AJ005]QFP75030.1 helicase [Deinococcus sp. AJ005]
MTKTNEKKQVRPPRVPSAWTVLLGDHVNLREHGVELPGGLENYRDIAEGDGLAIVEAVGGEQRVLKFAGVFRLRGLPGRTVVYFDAETDVESEPSLEAAGIGVAATTSPLERLEWSVFEGALRGCTGSGFDALPVVEDQAYLRSLMRLAFEDDLLGPAEGPEEEIPDMGVRDRYLVGKLAPRDSLPYVVSDAPEEAGEAQPDLRLREGVASDPGQEFGQTSGRRDVEEEPAELDPSTNASLVPSSMGLTFCVADDTTHLTVRASWGRYERRESERHVTEKTGKPSRVWKRVPMGGELVLPLDLDGDAAPMTPDPSWPSVVVDARVRWSPNGKERLVTLFLVNMQSKPASQEDVAWLFQPELTVRDLAGKSVFRRRPPLEADGADEEREALEMLYRRQVEFAVGHNTSVTATVDPEDRERAVEVRTSVVPAFEVPVTETPALGPDVPADLLDMRRLAAMERGDLVTGLTAFTDDYAAWIGRQRAKLAPGTATHDPSLDDWNVSAADALTRCDGVLARLREGVRVLEQDDLAFEAFRFANLAMADQRVHSIWALQRRRGGTPDLAAVDADPRNRSWRAFQLAFVLLSLPSLADPSHPDRTSTLEAEADLLWFPTGGGKTEAYLGVAAFAMAVRRLQGDLGGLDGTRGLTVIMRYTLRLLTLQQFQRATTLVCAMEVLRTADSAKWGIHPFGIGLWVGMKSTPNTTKDSHKSIKDERDGNLGTGSTPAQLTTCPWCGSPIDPKRDVVVDLDQSRTRIYCSDSLSDTPCRFSKDADDSPGLPVVVVDEEIYRRPPSMLIATVDKFALMAWRGAIRTLFGRADEECPRHGLIWPDVPDCSGTHAPKGRLPKTTVRKIVPLRPPDLIIQDEFHLISGPLGTMVGLYETAIDALCSWTLDGRTVRPKVIASTATVRKAAEQVNNVFLRRVTVFPPHGVDVEDNYFSVRRDVADVPGRLYLGICAPGSSKPAMLIRIYVALLTAGQALFDRFGQQADPYMTLVGYFNSLRDLGGMKRLAEDDVQTRSYRVEMSRIGRPGLRQRGVREVEELTSRISSRKIPATLDRLEVKHKAKWGKGEDHSVDIVLATNMLSVGVDINRLGLMAVNGQPKTTAEYIQATSRVGRSFPGLVVTALAWSRPRDLSHYETFEHYHATFYKHVEAQSVTPFAPRAMDRGLTGTLVSMLRLGQAPLNPNTGAGRLDHLARTEIAPARAAVQGRAGNVTGSTEVEADTGDMLAHRFDRWVHEAARPGRELGYEKGGGTVAPLLSRPGLGAWELFTAPTSLREVEPGVRLIMSQSKVDDGPAWRTPSVSGRPGERE